VLHYDLNIKINPEEKYIVGYNDITFGMEGKSDVIQLDLFENMEVDSIIYDSKKLTYKREFNAVFIDFTEALQSIGNKGKTIRFYYSGKPIIAKNAPWDGGFVFTKDRQGKDWVGVACQGTGASLWYPCKDSQSDEPDFGATIKVAVPNGLMNVSNGRFMGSVNLKNGYTRWDWEVNYTINTYSITVNIGDYVKIHENYKGLNLDYYVLRENEAIAKVQFEQVKPMLDCFQSKFGEYPFKEDGYKCIGFGAAAKGQTVLCYSELHLDYIIDENPLKINLFSPKLNIPIVDIDYFINDKTDKIVIVILAWNFASEIKDKIKLYKGEKDIYVIEAYFPEIVIRKLF
jgi:aminopeptidase N